MRTSRARAPQRTFWSSPRPTGWISATGRVSTPACPPATRPPTKCCRCWTGRSPPCAAAGRSTTTRNQKQPRKRQQRRSVLTCWKSFGEARAEGGKKSTAHSRVVLQGREIRAQGRSLHPLQHRVRSPEDVQIARRPDVDVAAIGDQQVVIALGGKQSRNRS